MLTAGQDAPDFELRSHKGGTVKLSDFRGKQNVVLAFHPLAFTPVCANQMRRLESDLASFEQAGAAVLGISIDAQPAKAAWAKSLDSISYDLLSDFHPHGEVAKQVRSIQGKGRLLRAGDFRHRQVGQNRLVEGVRDTRSAEKRRSADGT